MLSYYYMKNVPFRLLSRLPGERRFCSMTEKEKRTILDMRAAGKQYKEISAELGIWPSARKRLRLAIDPVLLQ